LFGLGVQFLWREVYLEAGLPNGGVVGGKEIDYTIIYNRIIKESRRLNLLDFIFSF